jgi:hypothetical protein
MLNGYVPPEFISKEMYNAIKKNKDGYDEKLVGLVGICASYNGNWFSSYGAIGIRSSNGHIEEYYKQAVKNVQKQCNKLRDVKFRVREYQDLKTQNMNVFLAAPTFVKEKDLEKILKSLATAFTQLQLFKAI